MKIKAVVKIEHLRERMDGAKSLMLFYEFTFGMMLITSVCRVKVNECYFI
ncbi:TPA: hypothetical protein IAA91_01865 [Candidatus Avacholeplasma faecigallinarum]|nr:hypothetical protein [Candidatus Avacholeplasma faecigallinarum]